MKKYLLIISMALGVMVAATSCGGDKKTTDDTNTNEATEEAAAPEAAAEPEDNTLKPPFTIIGVQDTDEHNRQVVTLTFDQNGMYEVTIDDQDNNSGEWKTSKNVMGNEMIKTKTGKWTTNPRVVAEQIQKVYCAGEEDPAYYVPETGEYIYEMWEDCDNLKRRAQNDWWAGYTVVEIKK